MKYHIAFKFLAVLLCACCLLVSLGAAAGIVTLAEAGLYDNTVQQLQKDTQESRLRFIAEDIAYEYAMENLSNLPEEALSRYLHIHNYVDWIGDAEVFYHLQDLEGNLLAEHVDPEAVLGVESYPIDIYAVVYPTVLAYRLSNPFTGQEISAPEITGDPMEPTTDATEATVDPMAGWINDTVMPSEDGLYDYYENWGYEDQEGLHSYRFGMRRAPKMTVTLYLTDSVYEFEDHWSWELAEFGYIHRHNVMWVLGGALLLFAVLLVYLCCSAGRKPKSEEVCPGGLNRLPLDLYGAVVAVAVFGISVLGWDLMSYGFDWDQPQWLLALPVGLMAFVACLLIVAFLFACAAQFKMKQFYWIKHSLIFLALVGAWKLVFFLIKKLGSGGKWFAGELLPLLKKIFIALWTLFVKIWKGFWSLIGSMFRFFWRTLQKFARLLPVTWQWLLVGLGMIFVLLICFNVHSVGGQFFGVALCICVVMYGAHCFGVLLESTKRMSQGDLDTKVDDKLLLGSFEEYATHLNALADVAMEAARKQMKSERMKAELVTNVSHDIKTPLTSIINYVDLMEKAQSKEEAQEYLEVLSRQSQRLKKLIEDLMEMSKASTGNMHVELASVDVGEAINQALGEFSEKLEAAQLSPVLQLPGEPLRMVADGRLTWRVLSNLLSNAVKYAMPGTRLYIDVVAVEGQVLLSMKNISAQQLNIQADELLERFVRGDASRNTEGSGLGLNIAKSLMQLQGGDLQLLVDGDLFKVTLVFKKAE